MPDLDLDFFFLEDFLDLCDFDFDFFSDLCSGDNVPDLLVELGLDEELQLKAGLAVGLGDADKGGMKCIAVC